MKYLNFLVLLLAVSCSNGEVSKNPEETYRTSGVEKFFLPELPTWANTSPVGDCVKTSSFQYLDFSKVAATYQLGYPQLVELQAQYNEKLETYFRSSAVRFLKPVEESSFFSNTLEQVRGGITQLKLPEVSEIDVIWLEGFLKEGKLKELKKMASSGAFERHLPVLFSSCHSKQSLTQWISENDLEEVGFYTIGAEYLSPFGSEVTLKPGLRLELSKFLGPKIKAHLITPVQNKIPSELIIN